MTTSINATDKAVEEETEAAGMKAPSKSDKRAAADESTVSGGAKVLIYAVLIFLTVVFLGPIFFILLNSFKDRFAISTNPFALPVGELWAGLTNYVTGVQGEGFGWAIVWSFVITISSVVAVVFFSAMTAYYITLSLIHI